MTVVIVNRAPWTRRAACLGNYRTFFPEGADKRHQTERARRICAVCPVRRPCLELALEAEGSAPADARYGVYGGCTPQQRRRIWDRRTELLQEAS